MLTKIINRVKYYSINFGKVNKDNYHVCMILSKLGSQLLTKKENSSVAAFH